MTRINSAIKVSLLMDKKDGDRIAFKIFSMLVVIGVTIGLLVANIISRYILKDIGA